MPRRDPRERLRDMADAARAITSYVEGLDLESFREDRRTVDAVLRNVTVLGEAARGVPAEVREMGPGIPLATPPSESAGACASYPSS